jgi:hypothetical protein
MATIQEAMDAAQRSHPYYRTALGSIRLQPNHAVPTMATSAAWVTHYNPDTLARWTPAEGGAVLVHELEHLLRKHHERCGDRDPGNFNLAGDAEINQRLADLPEGAIYPESLGMPRGQVAERYYTGLQSQQPQQPQGGEGGEGESGEGESGEGGEGGESGEGAGQQQQPGSGAAGTAQCGSAAGGGTQPHEAGDAENPGMGAHDNGESARKDAAESILNGTYPGTGEGSELREWAESELGIDRAAWYRAMATIIGSAMSQVGAPTRWSWTPRRDPRDVGGAVLPRWTGERPKVAVVLDTSSSITPADLDLARAAGYFLGRLAECHYYTCDTMPEYIGRTLPERIYGGGGTNMEAGIRQAIAEGARAVIVITDCYTRWDRNPDTHGAVPIIIGANVGASRVIASGPENGWYPPEHYTVVPVVPQPEPAPSWEVQPM